jgi:hypothetical protein
MQLCEAPAGSMIFQEGEVGEYAGIIRTGRVQILKRSNEGEVELAVLGPGEVLGEMSLFEPQDKRSGSARALEHVTVDLLTAEEMQQMLEYCPDELQPFLRALVSRLRETNRRLAEKERATVRLGHKVQTLHLSPYEVLANIFTPFSYKVTNLPFCIGGYDAGAGSPPRRCELEIPCDPARMNVSYEHCTLEDHPDGVYLIDNGSRFKTIVNGRSIGRGEASNKALLLPGKNDVVLGDAAMDMRLLIECE